MTNHAVPGLDVKSKIDYQQYTEVRRPLAPPINALAHNSRKDTCNFTINFMLLVLVIVLFDWFTRCKAQDLAVSLARVQYLYFVQPLSSIPPVVEGMVV